MSNDPLYDLLTTAAQERWDRLDLHRRQSRRFPVRRDRHGHLIVEDRAVAVHDWLPDRALTELPATIGRLTELRELRLSGNQLSSLPPQIGWLAQLELLDLSENELTALPPQIGCLTNLRQLSLKRNRLTSLPPELGCLTRLERLELDGNRLTSLPATIGALQALRWLGLSGNCCARVPEALAHLTNLTGLDLAGNQLGELSPLVGYLVRLRYLYLFRNRLATLPPQLGCLGELEQLHLFGNVLEGLPPQVGLLGRLQLLDLRDNRLTALPAELGRLNLLKWLDVSGNPDLRDPPVEVLALGTRATLAFLRGQQEQPQPQWTAKVLLVGEANVGKTSLLRCLRREKFDPQSATTHGIEISPLQLSHPTRAGVTLQLRAWDFGGQQIYHAIHQFFLSNRALFLLVWNARQNREQNRLVSWLELIRARAPEASILLVATHADQWKAVETLADLRKRYPQVRGQVVIDCATGQGIDPLRAEMARAAAELPRMGEAWPKRWVEAAAELRRCPDQLLPARQLLERFEAAQVPEDEAEVLLQWLHDLGELLHFGDDPGLKDVVLLRPQWAAQLIGRVLEDAAVQQQGGLFTWRDQARLWSDVPVTLWGPLLRLMERFDLAYRVHDSADSYLIVDCLPVDPPSYEAEWADPLKRAGCQELTLRFRLRTVPAGIPTRFIARMQRFQTGRQWHEGILLADEARDHLGLLRLDVEQRLVELRVRGPSPQNFFSVLRDGFEATLQRFPGLQVERKVPCPCSRASGGCREEFDLPALERVLLARDRKPYVQCHQSGTSVYVPGLLFGLHPETSGSLHERLEKLLEILPQTGSLLLELRNLGALIQRQFSDQFRSQQVRAEVTCPNLFLLRAADRADWLPALTTGRVELHLCCQEPGCWHPVAEGGRYLLPRAPHWLRALRPYLQGMLLLMRYTAPASGPWLGKDREGLAQLWQDDLKGMELLLAELPDLEAAGVLGAAEEAEAEGAHLRLLRRLLEELDAKRVWGGLERMVTPEGSVLWLCPHHAGRYRR